MFVRGSSGGGDKGVTEFSMVNAISLAGGQAATIPTTKKAKGIVIRGLLGTTNFLYVGYDGVGDNKLYRYDAGGYASQVVTYNDNSINITYFASSAMTLYPIILY